MMNYFFTARKTQAASAKPASRLLFLDLIDSIYFCIETIH